ncbi:MAG: DNA-3-methyladenine glycosylase I [Bacteroidetes bacterium]|nr:DNA-3-methyladenine glycosylase I [Bacteroidota bacterium]
MERKTCEWPNSNPLIIAYHDKEWGVPLHDDRKIFEFMALDAFQAGLSWAIILKKRTGFHKAFDGFDFNRIARYDEGKIQELLADDGIIRNQLKIKATVNNAIRFAEVRKEFETFDKYIWQFTGFKTIDNRLTSLGKIPSKSRESDAMSRDLQKRGFKFVGSTICYAFMQAAGMVNDHLVDWGRHKELMRMK